MSKERLTEKTKDCFGYRLKDGSDAEVGFFKDYDAFYSHMMTVKALGEYEDLEEQNLLLRVPCHCKDCKHVDYEGCARTTCYCMKKGAFMQEDDFCKHAEQSEAEEKLRELEGK